MYCMYVCAIQYVKYMECVQIVQYVCTTTHPPPPPTYTMLGIVRFETFAWELSLN